MLLAIVIFIFNIVFEMIKLRNNDFRDECYAVSFKKDSRSPKHNKIIKKTKRVVLKIGFLKQYKHGLIMTILHSFHGLL